MILLLAATIAAAAPAPACPDARTAEAFVCRALAASKAGDERSAAEAFEQAAAAQTNEVEKARSLAAAGNMWIAANEPGKAALALDKALAGNSLQAEQRGEALLDRARAAEAQNDLKAARSGVTEASKTISEDPFLWYFSAALAIREGDAGTAKAAIGKALSLAPSDPIILFEAGHVFHFAGQIDEARRYWAQARDHDPNGPVGSAARQAMDLLPVIPADGTSGAPHKPAPVPPPR